MWDRKHRVDWLTAASAGVVHQSSSSGPWPQHCPRWQAGQQGQLERWTLEATARKTDSLWTLHIRQALLLVFKNWANVVPTSLPPPSRKMSHQRGSMKTLLDLHSKQCLFLPLEAEKTEKRMTRMVMEPTSSERLLRWLYSPSFRCLASMMASVTLRLCFKIARA